MLSSTAEDGEIEVRISVGYKMGLLQKILAIGIAITAISVWYLYKNLTATPPQLNLQSTWWGPGKARKVDESIRPFKINISQEILDDLSDRLELLPDLTPPLEGIGFQYGFNTQYLKKIWTGWTYIFSTSSPNKSRHRPVCYLYYCSMAGQALYREFYEIIPLLTTPREGVNFVFEVVVPSLPGYGFSEGASKPGLGTAQMAVVFKDLMARLGFDKFYLQGGDWGAIIGSNMATLYQDNVLGFHSNMCFVNTLLSNLKMLLGSLWPTLVVEEELVHRMYPLSKIYSNLILEMGYMHIQATKPDTIGVSLRDSPVGLAAYILEKFSTWTNPAWQTRPDGGLTEKFSLTNLLDNIMIYWVTGSITTSVRLYSESFSKAQFALELDSIPTKVPTACAMFPFELAYQPESLLKDKYHNLVQFHNMPRGGHFAAFEEPRLLADDIWSAVKLIQKQK
uniref:Epoxide hydrolase n=1 Tax=Timema cristinae TaxID=61476 RepID=A0A7R9GR35_TIMCR|nr:unnamed protein product [Timema cristinae]